MFAILVFSPGSKERKFFKCEVNWSHIGGADALSNIGQPFAFLQHYGTVHKAVPVRDSIYERKTPLLRYNWLKL